jgi:hypothetical protein
MSTYWTLAEANKRFVVTGRLEAEGTAISCESDWLSIVDMSSFERSASRLQSHHPRKQDTCAKKCDECSGSATVVLQLGIELSLAQALAMHGPVELGELKA